MDKFLTTSIFMISGKLERRLHAYLLATLFDLIKICLNYVSVSLCPLSWKMKCNKLRLWLSINTTASNNKTINVAIIMRFTKNIFMRFNWLREWEWGKWYGCSCYGYAHTIFQMQPKQQAHLVFLCNFYFQIAF